MKKIALLFFLVALLTACAQKKQTSASTPPPPAPTTASSTATSQSAARDELHNSVSVLDAVMSTPSSTVPDGILNRSRCLVILMSPGSQGVASCRSASDAQRWSGPVFVNVSSAGAGADPNSSWFLFVLTDRAAKQLQAGSVDLASMSVVPGLLARTSPTVTDVDLGHDVMTYQARSDSFNAATFQPTTIAFDQNANQQFYGGKPTFQNVLSEESRPKGTPKEFIAAVTSYFNTIEPVGIIIHHSGTLPGSNRVPKNVAQVDSYHEQRGYDVYCFGKEYHVAYHYLIFPNGKVKEGRPERCEGAHAVGYNGYLGISLVGDFSSRDNPNGKKGPARPTPEQMVALEKLTAELRSKYHIPVNRVIRHSDIGVTDCPGDRFEFKQLLTALERTP